MTKEYEVCHVSELPPGERKIVEIAGQSIGLFNIGGEFYALKNVCPHHLAPLCEGSVTGTVKPSDNVGEYKWARDGEIIRCPWHKWEFDIQTGESVYNPHRIRTRTYDTEVETQASTQTHENIDCPTEIQGEHPPVDTFDTTVEHEVIIVYV